MLKRVSPAPNEIMRPNSGRSRRRARPPAAGQPGAAGRHRLLNDLLVYQGPVSHAHHGAGDRCDKATDARNDVDAGERREAHLAPQQRVVLHRDPREYKRRRQRHRHSRPVQAGRRERATSGAMRSSRRRASGRAPLLIQKIVLTCERVSSGPGPWRSQGPCRERASGRPRLPLPWRRDRSRPA